MPATENQIQIGDLQHQIDWRSASRAIRCRPGRIVIEMLPVPTKVGSLYLPDSNTNIRPDVGVVIANGTSSEFPFLRSVYKGRYWSVPQLGTLVAVRPYDGSWLEGADMGTYRPEGQIRVYGAFKSKIGDKVEACSWWDSLVCEILEDKNLRPLGNNSIFRLDPMNQTEGGIILSSQTQYRTGMATVVAIGPAVFDLEVGDRVCVDLEKIEDEYLMVDGLVDKDLRVGSDLAINYVLEK